jgi:hypothetical protein
MLITSLSISCIPQINKRNLNTEIFYVKSSDIR